jgi:hypothetical protein
MSFKTDGSYLMTYKCTNNYCPYGPAWDEGKPAPRNGPHGSVLECDRSELCDQDETRQKAGRSANDGYCLNCCDDQRKAAENSDLYNPL